jgi:uncharacterized protein YjbI with pentapeptide repeats
MHESESKNEKPKEERRFSQEQYDMLKRCSDKKDMTEWNEWREEHPDEEIWLQGRNFSKWYLKGAFLATDVTPGIHKEVHLEKAFLPGAHLEGADLSFAHLEGANLHSAHLVDARLYNAYLQGAHLNRAHMEKTNLRFAHLENANLWFAHLEEADLTGRAHLQGANFLAARVDHSTLIWKCEVNRYSQKARYTDFSAVSLDNASIDPGTKQLLEYNIRRKNWGDWYTKHIFLRWPVRWFWSVSNYGLSTWRIIGWFLMLSLFFAAVYSNIACWYPQGIVSNLKVEPHLPLWHYFILLLLRPIYFSVVTMTTLGFGDMYANALSIWGHLLLTIQVILGYVLLGALVTRFAVLFTAGGPAGKFSD